jgi:hypothetical protein
LRYHHGVKRGPEHERLDVFVGRWHTRGEILAGGANAAATLEAIDTYEWLPGGFFLLHHVDGRMGGEVVQALEIIGYDASRPGYFTHAFDSQGRFSSYESELRDGALTIRGRTERFSGQFSPDGGTLTGSWERSDDGGRWSPWMKVTLKKSLSA